MFFIDLSTPGIRLTPDNRGLTAFPARHYLAVGFVNSGNLFASGLTGQI